MYLMVTQRDPSVFNLLVETTSFLDFRTLNLKRNLLPRTIKVVSSPKKMSGSKPPIFLNDFLLQIMQCPNAAGKGVNWRKTNLYKTLSLSPIKQRVQTLLHIYDLDPSPSEKAINYLSDICKKNCKPLVAYIPASSFYWNRSGSENKYKNQLKNLANKAGINFIDGQKVIDTNNLDDYAPKGSHLSIDGYKKFSDLLSDIINTEE